MAVKRSSLKITTLVIQVDLATKKTRRIGIFIRSHYEELLVVRVHPQVLREQKLPSTLKENKEIWENRFEDIKNFEKYLDNNGIKVLKFFLNISKDEQKKRFFERLTKPHKNWKFSINDVKERIHWNSYMKVYEDMINHTSASAAPWYIVPAGHKWFARAVVADIVITALENLKLKYPIMSEEEHKKNLDMLRKALENEKD